MAYSGKYKPINPRKYKGDPTNVIYRSMWEKKFMIFCDSTPAIVEWGSEEVVVPYKCPTDGRVHRYFPDVYMKVRDRNGNIQKYIIEIKPKKQVEGPPKSPKRKTKQWKYEVLVYAKNKAKWKAAESFCRKRDMKFLILTEDHLKV